MKLDCDECHRENEESTEEKVDDGQEFGKDPKKIKIFDWTTVNNSHRRRHSCSSRRGSSGEESGNEFLVESKHFVDQRKLN